MITRSSARVSILLVAAALALSGCAATPAPLASDDAVYPDAASAISITDPWVKSAESGMSAAFGAIENASPDDVTVVSASTAASSMVELHETLENEAGEMVMRPIEGGFVIPAGGSLALEPGGNHIMLMGLAAPLKAGEDLTFTLTFSDDSTLSFTAPVKDYSGANETYESGDMDMDQ